MRLPPSPCASPSQDRKSTRLNSSHVATSYAVFCLKKKTVAACSGAGPSSMHVGHLYSVFGTSHTNLAVQHMTFPSLQSNVNVFSVLPGPHRTVHSVPTRRSSD